MLARLLLALALLVSGPAVAQQAISNLPQVATPRDADLLPLDVQSFPLGQRTHSVSAAGLAQYLLGKIPLGPQGIPGNTGPVGPANSLSVGTVSASDPGSNPLVSIVGTAPSQVLNFTFPRGAAGPQGPQGLAGATGPAGPQGVAGPTGAAGPPNVLSIGTVGTSDAGAPAAASVSGAAPNQALNLTLPRGIQGPVGPIGPTGNGTGNVLGPSGGSTAAHVATFSDTTGTRLSDGGVLGTAAAQPVAFFAQAGNNLSDLASSSAARLNLGLGTLAVRSDIVALDSSQTQVTIPNSTGNPGVATILAQIQATANAAVPKSTVGQPGGVASYGDSRITGALQLSNALSELAAAGSQAAARANLGLGSLATLSTLSGLDASGTNVLATGGTALRSLADKAADVFDVMAYGAACNGTTDDTAAINAAAAAMRTQVVAFGMQTARLQSPRTRNCFHTGSLNLTNLKTRGISIDLTLTCAASGVTCVDGTGSQYIYWDHLYENGTTALPNLGLALMTPDGSGAGGHFLNDVNIQGYFKTAPLYNSGSEDMTAVNLKARNVYTGTANFGVILDAYHHFGVTSQFVTITRAADVSVSMNSVDLGAAAIYSAGPATGTTANGLASPSAPLWIGGPAMVKFTRGYLAALNTPLYGVVLYSEGVNSFPHIDLDVHIEHSPNLLYAFYVTGNFATPTPVVFNGFKYQDHNGQYANAVFKTDTATVSSVALGDADIDITDVASGTLPLLDLPALYSASGKITVPNAASWTEPGLGFTGTVCFANRSGTPLCIPYVPTEPINRNPDFLVDQQTGAVGATGSAARKSAAAGYLGIDGWHTQGGGATLQFQQSTIAPPGYSTSLSVTVTAAGGTPGATSQQRIESSIEGPEIAPAQMGTSAAIGFTDDFWAYSNVVGEFDRYYQNNARSRTYIAPFTIAVANTWQHVVLKIPGDNGAWPATPGQPGLRYGVAILAGTNSQGTANAWQSGTYYATTTGATFYNTVGNQIYIGADHIIPGQYDMPYRPRSFDRELTLARRFYQQSTPYGTNPVASASPGLGGVDAVTTRLPYGGSTFASWNEPVRFQQPMAITPTVTLLSTGAATSNCYDATTAADAGAASSVNLGPKGFSLQCGIGSANALGDLLQAHWKADTGL